MQVDLADITAGLVNDLKDLRAKKITNADARVRAQLAKEILKSINIQMEGLKIITAKSPKRLTQD